MENNHKDKITFVMTSCNRFDLLATTLQSFLFYNTYPIEHYIFIEDSNKMDKLDEIIRQYPVISDKVLLLNNDPKLGQIKSIDRAYSYIKTPYIFHCEEDWSFYKKGFIEDSLSILKNNSKIINVWLRELNDTNGHPHELPLIEHQNNLSYYFMAPNYLGWHGFTFNPTVKRLKNYEDIRPYQQIGHEQEIGKVYFDKGFRAVILSNGYVKHQGYHRRVLGGDNYLNVQLEIDAWLKKQKAKLFKQWKCFWNRK